MLKTWHDFYTPWESIYRPVCKSKGFLAWLDVFYSRDPYREFIHHVRDMREHIREDDIPVILNNPYPYTQFPLSYLMLYPDQSEGEGVLMERVYSDSKVFGYAYSPEWFFAPATCRTNAPFITGALLHVQNPIKPYYLLELGDHSVITDRIFLDEEGYNKTTFYDLLWPVFSIPVPSYERTVGHYGFIPIVDVFDDHEKFIREKFYCK